MDEIKTTEIWNKYSKGVQYNRMKQLYDETDKNYKFYNGKQWEGLKTGKMEPIVLNIIKPIVKYKLGIINTNGYEVIYKPNNYESEEFQKEMQDVCKQFNKHASRVMEQEQIQRKIKEAMKDSCINSEGIHYYYNNVNKDGENELKCEVIDKTNIYYGNENEPDIQEQPYMIISFRRTVEDVKEEAKLKGVPEEEINNIISDNETEEQTGHDNIEEISPMCLELLYLYKKNGTVHYSKATKTVIIEEDQDTKMNLYPVAHVLWDDEKGSARGLGEVETHRANQMEINKTAMRRAISIKLGAYPKLVANVSKIVNPSALEQTGATIKVNGMTVDDVRKEVGYLNPAHLSSDSKELQTELITNTRELAGAGDIASGNVNPEQASGKAILAIQQASQQPLNEQVDKFKTFLEDIARIWFEIWKTYNVEGMTVLKTKVLDDKTEIEVPYTIPATALEKLKIGITIEITPKSPFDRYAQEMSLENLLIKNLITFEEYVEALDDDSSMPKKKLENILKKREERKAEIEAMQQQVHKEQLEMQNKLNLLQQEADEKAIGGIESDVNNHQAEVQKQLGQSGGEPNEMQGM